jgi:predicted hydrocarbon binding protein
MAKGAKAKRGVPVRRKAARRRKPTLGSVSVTTVRSGRELLIRKMLGTENSGGRRLLVQDLIYNATGDLKKLAYGSGFDLGTAIYDSSDKTIGALERTLENAGFGKVLYRPFESYSTITSYKAKAGAEGLGADIHAFESGLIAGYLSAHARRPVYVREPKCVYNGSEFCQFVASPREHGDVRERVADLRKMTRTIKENVMFAGGHGAGGSYTMLFSQPLLEEPVLTEASKLMYLTGKRIADKGRVEDFDDKIVRMAKYLGAESASVKRKRGKVIEIDLTYGNDGSVANFVDLTTSMLAGFARGVLNKNVYIQRRLNGKRKYSVRMELLSGSGARAKKA